METSSLAVYRLDLVPRVEEVQPISSWEAVAPYLNERDRILQRHDDSATVLRLERVQISAPCAWGIVNSGDYGYENDIVNIDTGSTAYHVQRQDAPLRPFFFRFHCSERRPYGFLCVQRIGVRGIVTALARDFAEHSQRVHPGIRLALQLMIPADAFRRYLERGQVKKIRIAHRDKSPDATDNLADRGYPLETAEIELVLRPKRRKWFTPRYPVVSAKDVNVFDLFGLPDAPFEPNMVKLEVKLGKHTRVIRLDDEPLSHHSFPLPQDIECGADGWPDFDAMNSFADEILGDHVLMSQSGAYDEF